METRKKAECRSNGRVILFNHQSSDGYEIPIGRCPIPIDALIELPEYGVCRVDTLIFNPYNLLSGIVAEGYEGDYAGQWISFNTTHWPLSSLPIH